MSVFAPLFEPRRSARLLQPVKKGPVKKGQQSPRALRFLKRQQLQVQVEGGRRATSTKRKKVLDDVADDDKLFQQPAAKRRKGRESDTPPPPPPPPPPTEKPQPIVVDVDINVDREQPAASSSKTTLEPAPTPTTSTTPPATTSNPLPIQFIIEKPFARSYHTAITFDKKDDDEMQVEADAEDDSESDDDDDDDEWLIPHSRKKTELDIWRFACRRRVDHITHQYTPSIIRDFVSQDARRHHTPRDEEDYLTEEIFDWELDSESDSEDEPPLITFALTSPPASPLDPPQQLLPLPPPRLSTITLPELVAQYGFAESTPPPTPSLCTRIGKGTPIDPARRAAWAQTPIQPPPHSPTPELDPRMWDEFLEKINREPFDAGMNGVESFTNMLFEGETGF
ncbi:uncharacterized protein EV420DRAFT_1634792 [Desarmillaria tabescens]|uniref:Uncharacterized protein n=1 Tax=Armillaria tabescens TaxID=1929756 RepID=A0AA39U470_ARMTA|nr:uncharacterized protein EV420DRAFT_1634792 [Desarmillaria tabescens]KAK0470369.1 hypothetical protein EV420DRAFT_1634792 [Desarmillaria tabescens]